MGRLAVVVLAAAGCNFDAATGAVDAPGAVDSVVAIDGAVDAPPPPIDGRPDARPIDARPPDAMVDAGFTIADCPPSYDRTIAGNPTSRYRYIATATTFAAQHADCNDDHAFWTHLVALDSMAEAMAIGQYNPSSYSYVGAVQMPGQTATNTGWFVFTGTPVTTGWSPQSGGQPDDGDGTESGQEGLAVVASTGNMHDVGGNGSYTAACECDGMPIAATVAPWIPGS